MPARYAPRIKKSVAYLAGLWLAFLFAGAGLLAVSGTASRVASDLSTSRGPSAERLAGGYEYDVASWNRAPVRFGGTAAEVDGSISYPYDGDIRLHTAGPPSWGRLLAAEGAADAGGVGRLFVSTAEGHTVPVPGSFTARVADNGAGLVYQEGGAAGNANLVRIMDPTTKYQQGYMVYYNAYGQPLDAAGGIATKASMHIPLGEGGGMPGYYQWLEQFLR